MPALSDEIAAHLDAALAANRDMARQITKLAQERQNLEIGAAQLRESLEAAVHAREYMRGKLLPREPTDDMRATPAIQALSEGCQMHFWLLWRALHDHMNEG